MVPKPGNWSGVIRGSFRAVLFRMVPKHESLETAQDNRFRAVLFRMVPKPSRVFL